MALPPPPARQASLRVRRGFEALAADKEKMDAVRKNAEASEYFDVKSFSSDSMMASVPMHPDAFAKLKKDGNDGMKAQLGKYKPPCQRHSANDW
jgi:hypothetical protein